MLNWIWAGMLLMGIVYGMLTGNVMEITNAALDSAKEAVDLCVTMMGVMSFWVGLMEIGKEAGLLEKASKKLRPVVRFLFPNLPAEHKANEAITLNIMANILGLGWAATPAGLQAMEELKKLEDDRRNGKVSGIKRERGVAGNEMCTFLILNISSLQLLPMNVIAYRSQYGSVNPASIVGPGIIATTLSTAVAILYCKWKDRRKESHV